MPARSKVLQRRETLVSYMFPAPALIFFVGFVISPMAYGRDHQLYQCQFSGSQGDVPWICGITSGFSQDKIFLKSAVNTVIIVGEYRFLPSLHSLCGLEQPIYRMRSGIRSFFRCVFYLPVVTGSVAVVVVWNGCLTSMTAFLTISSGALGGSRFHGPR